MLVTLLLMQLQAAIGYRVEAIGPGWWSRIWEAEQTRLTLWLPVFMGVGVLAYYELRFEPPFWLGAAALVPAMTAAALLRQYQPCQTSLPVLVAVALGFTSAQFATARAPPPLAGVPSRATMTAGVIHAVEALPDGRRITLESVRLDDAPDPLPRRVRVRLHRGDTTNLETGDTVRVRSLLRPPAPPSYPGAWDLQRDAYYGGLGASGFALGPVEVLEQAVPSGPARLVQRLRESIAHHVTEVVPGAAGAVSVTLLTGASIGIPEDDRAAFRDSGLAHLLAVAGLHIGIVMGFALALSRLAFALSEHASLRWPTRKLSAAIALATGCAYMVLTGMHVPIVRSFVMACLFTAALLAGRRAVSVRGLGLAAVVLMLLEPQEVPNVSFQMSFSAVLALISGYEALRPWLLQLHGRSWPRRFASHLLALALTSALAGTASMPYGAYHFGHIQVYYVIANMAAVPLTALWVMPLGLIALPLMPLGLGWLALVPMGWGAEGILWIAHTATAWPWSTIAVPHMPAWGLAVLSAGLAWLGIWRTWIRLAGVAAIALGVASPVWTRPPDLLISADARLIALRTDDDVFMQQTQGGSRFTRDAWLQYWAADHVSALPLQGDAAGGAVTCVSEACLLRPHPDARAALLVRGARHPAGCAESAVIVSAEPARGLCPKPWPRLVDRITVWRDGAAAVWLMPGGARVLTDRQTRGNRPWVPPPPTPHARPMSPLPPATIDRAD